MLEAIAVIVVLFFFFESKGKKPPPKKMKRERYGLIRSTTFDEHNVIYDDHNPTIFGIPEQEWLTKKKLYMSSELWNIKRKRILKRDNYTCQKCQAKYVPLDVHHISYKHVGDEPLKTLTSVCRTCHSNLHQELGYDYEREYPLT